MLKEFKEFIARGNIVEIAVGLVVALAFKAVVDALVANLMTPIVGALFGQPDFSRLTIDLWNDAALAYGAFLNEVFSFLAVAAALFFFVVKPYNVLQARMADPEDTDVEAPAPAEEIVLLREIRDSLRA